MYACGLVQALKPPPSNWHSKVEPASVLVKLKLASSTNARIWRLSRDRGVRRYRVNRPAVAGRRWVSITGAINGAYFEGVGAVCQAGVRLRAGASAETTAIQLALKGRTSFVAGEAETGISAIARIGWFDP